jgi:hypothetical protein
LAKSGYYIELKAKLGEKEIRLINTQLVTDLGELQKNLNKRSDLKLNLKVGLDNDNIKNISQEVKSIIAAAQAGIDNVQSDGIELNVSSNIEEIDTAIRKTLDELKNMLRITRLILVLAWGLKAAEMSKLTLPSRLRSRLTGMYQMLCPAQ